METTGMHGATSPETPTVTAGGGVPRTTSTWATGLSLFAATMMIVIGFCQALAGIAAIIQDEVYLTTPNYVYNIDLTGWGWVHVALAVVLVITGIGVIYGYLWARIGGILVAGLAIIGNFMFIPYYPLWSLVLIALDVTVIWALASRRYERS
jgi:hypothetical protein